MCRYWVSLPLLLCVAGCTAPESGVTTPFSVDFEKYTLANGLEVVLHIDRSDPIVAVAMTSYRLPRKNTAASV